MTSFKRGDLIRFTDETGQDGFGVVLDPNTAFALTSANGRKTYGMSRRSLAGMRNVLPLHDREVDALAHDARIALQAVVVSTH